MYIDSSLLIAAADKKQAFTLAIGFSFFSSTKNDSNQSPLGLNSNHCRPF
jgi:hypothetical protein